MLSEIIDSTTLFFSILSNGLDGLGKVFKAIVENPLMLTLLILSLLSPCSKKRRRY